MLVNCENNRMRRRASTSCRALATASFSDRVTADAPGVKGPDLAGPGVDAYSASCCRNCGAVRAEANPTIRGQALKDLVMRIFTALSRRDRARTGSSAEHLKTFRFF